jgi:hypothetical protein
MTSDKCLISALGLVLLSGCSSGGGDSGGTNAKSFDYTDQVVRLDSDLVIPSGKTVRVGPGVTFQAAANVKIQVEGTLDVEATASSPSRFMGDSSDGGSHPNSWHGIEIESGGTLLMTHVEVAGAQYGVHAMPGSAYTVDYAVFGTSFKPAVLEADGTFDHTTFHATTPPTIAITVDVTIDDPNGTMTIMNASPKVTNSFFDGSSAVTDMVRIGGASSPVFDHVHLAKAHCAFHNFGANNNSPRVTNSVIEHMAFGAMAFTSKPVFEHSNFLNNANDVGYCYGATADNAPSLDGNYYLSGDATVDASCFQIGTKATGTVSAPIDGAGPVGLE